MEYILLLNSALKNHILNLPGKEKKRLQEKLEYLESGIWDSGLRVKKLKGTSGKVVFEARADKGDRILFTLGKHRENRAVYVWGIVKHDDISKGARLIAPDNAPFLGFESRLEERLNEVYFDDLGDDHLTQEGLEEKTPDDYGPQKWHRLDEAVWERLTGDVTDGENELEISLFLTGLQEQILSCPPPLLISGTAGSGKTTLSVYYLLREDLLSKKRLFLTYNRYLKDFSRKMYEGLVKNSSFLQEGPQPSFYVFKELLLEIAGSRSGGPRFESENEVDFNRFTTIFFNHPLYKKYDPELVWQEIRSIIKGAKPQISLITFKKLYSRFLAKTISREERGEFQEYLIELKNFSFFKKINRLVERKTDFEGYEHFVRGLDSSLDNEVSRLKPVLDEILKLIKNKAEDFSSPLLSFEEYQLLGKKRAPAFYYDREELYKIAQFYQAKLDEMGLWDEIDLCKRAIEVLESETGGSSPGYTKYDFVICDEIQDFADIQLYFILKLTHTYNNILFAGDPKQIINPSSFRWEEVKDKFYERGIQIPEVYNLKLNFRSVGSIVRLANALIDLKQKLVGLTDSEFKEEWKFHGSPPVVIKGLDESEALAGISFFSAGQVILVRSEEDKRKLKEHLKTELVFTIYEAKGLEFDRVLVWKFLSEKKYEDLWRKIETEHTLDPSHFPHIRHEINLLYVAITRARNTLLFYDGENSSYLWDIDILKEHVFPSGDRAFLEEMWNKISKPEEWEKQGDYFFEREYYPAAAECFKNAGNQKKQELAGAFVLESAGEFGRAGVIFEKQGYTERSAVNFEKAGEYQKAYELWLSLENREKALLCLIKVYEARGEYSKAAAEWVKLDRIDMAVANWEKARDFEPVGSYYFSRNDFEKAALYFEKVPLFEQAADSYRRVKKFRKAADLYFKAGCFSQAGDLYKKVGDTRQLVRCYKEAGDHYNLALHYEKEKELDKAGHYFTRFAGQSEQNRALLEEEITFFTGKKQGDLKCALRYAALEEFDKAGELFYAVKSYEMALVQFKKSENLEKQLACYDELKEYYKYAVTIEDSQQEERYELASRFFKKYVSLNAANLSYNEESFQKLEKEAREYFEEGRYWKAITRFRGMDRYEDILKAYIKLGDDEAAVSYYLDHIWDHNLTEYLKSREDLVLSEELFDRLEQKLVDQCRYESYEDEQKNYQALYILLTLYQKTLENPGQTVISVEAEKSENTASLPARPEQRLFSLFNMFINVNKHFLNFNDYKDASLDIHLNSEIYTFFELMVRVKAYNLIFSLCAYDLRPGGEDERTLFLDRVEKKAAELNDSSLQLCTLYGRDRDGNPDGLEQLISEISINENNYLLFSVVPSAYEKAVGLLKEQGAIEKAAGICLWHNNSSLAASIYEEAGKHAFVVELYLQKEEYDRALKYCRKNDLGENAARVYETMGDLKQALKEWKKLGNTKQIGRLEKKLNIRPL